MYSIDPTLIPAGMALPHAYVALHFRCVDFNALLGLGVAITKPLPSLELFGAGWQ